MAKNYPDAQLTTGETAPVTNVTANNINVKTKFGIVKFTRAGIAGDVKIKNVAAILATDPQADPVVWIRLTMYYRTHTIVRARLVKKTATKLSYIPEEIEHGKPGTLRIGQLTTQDIGRRGSFDATAIYETAEAAFASVLDGLVDQRRDAAQSIARYKNAHAERNQDIAALVAKYPGAWDVLIATEYGPDAAERARMFGDKTPDVPAIHEDTP